MIPLHSNPYAIIDHGKAVNISSTRLSRQSARMAPRGEAQSQRIFGPPYETLPNAWHPSDHLPVIASFSFL